MASEDRKTRSLEEIADTDIQTLADFPRCHAGRTPDKTAIVYEDRTLTYRQLNDFSDRIAWALGKAGVGRGDRVAFLDKNSDAFFPILFGASKAGATLVPVNFRLAPKEVAYILRDSGAKLIFAGEEFLNIVSAARADAGGLETVVAIDAGQGLPGWASASPGVGDLRDSPVPEETAVQMYTSGTTGHPKGVEITHHAMVRAAIEGLSRLAGDVSSRCGRLVHNAAVSHCCLQSWTGGPLCRRACGNPPCGVCG
jgi:acyl-CoA synthetase (AMP-forming)/AMP-acid ligase II